MQPDPHQTFPLPFDPVVVVRPPKRRVWLHVLLFLLTCFTCLVVGARMQQLFDAYESPFFSQDFFPLGEMVRNPRELLLGFPFAASLLAILFAHEMGHFLLAVRNHVYATLPYFLPAPTPIGTFGAFIQIRSRFHTRSELLDIAIGGPIAGFVVALPLTIIGLLLSKPLYPGSEEVMGIGYPLIFHLVHLPMHSAAMFNNAPLGMLLLHPIAIAAWIGMLATALNLLPGGQLDGGHILFAISPSTHKWLTTIFSLLLLIAAAFFWSGWLIWAIAFYITRKHPPVQHPEPRLPSSRTLLACAAVLLFLLTAIPAPFAGGGLLASFGIDVDLH